MNSTDRVTKAIEFGNPDRVPIQHFFSPESLVKHQEKLVDIFTDFPEDLGSSKFEIPDSDRGSDWILSRKYSTLTQTGNKFEQQYQDESILFTDAWGSVWGKGPEGRYVVEPALEDWEKLDDFTFPAPYPDRNEFEEEKEKIAQEKSETGRYILGYSPYRNYIVGGICFLERL